jgi:hypothetical protein
MWSYLDFYGIRTEFIQNSMKRRRSSGGQTNATSFEVDWAGDKMPMMVEARLFQALALLIFISPTVRNEPEEMR